MYSEFPPDFEYWGPLLIDDSPSYDKYGQGTSLPMHSSFRLGWWRLGFHHLKVNIGALVQVVFMVNGAKKLYIGVVVAKRSNGRWKVQFEDGDVQEFTEGDADFVTVFSTDYDIVFPSTARMQAVCRRKAPRVLLKSKPAKGPWEIWLENILPDLLLSIFRASLRDSARFDKKLLGAIENPESEDAFSDAGTPAQTKRRRSHD